LSLSSHCVMRGAGTESAQSRSVEEMRDGMFS
jgi:hypothetical protein